MRQFMKGKKNRRESLCCSSHRAGGCKPPPLPPSAVGIRPTLRSIGHTCSTSEAGVKHTAQLRLALLSPGVGESVVLKKFSHMDAFWLTVPAPDNFSDISLKSSPPNPILWVRTNFVCFHPDIANQRHTASSVASLNS